MRPGTFYLNCFLTRTEFLFTGCFWKCYYANVLFPPRMKCYLETGSTWSSVKSVVTIIKMTCGVSFCYLTTWLDVWTFSNDSTQWLYTCIVMWQAILVTVQNLSVSFRNLPKEALTATMAGPRVQCLGKKKIRKNSHIQQTSWVPGNWFLSKPPTPPRTIKQWGEGCWPASQAPIDSCDN